MKITDSATIGGTRITPEGYLEANVRVSRTGIQVYRGEELGKPEHETLRVYRGDEAVFDRQGLETFAHIPLTVNHPTELVTADNWKTHAVGTTGGEVLRDGDFLKIGIRITDADTVAAVHRGTRELSVGYEAQFDWTPGVTPSGEEYDGRQVAIRANHLAIVDRARAGSLARIGDSWGAAPVNTKEVNMTMKSLVLGDAAVQVADADAGKVEAYKAQVAKDAANAKAEADAKLSDKDKELAKKDAELNELKKKQVSDADLDARVQARAKLVGDARAIVKDYDSTGKSDAAIRRDVVTQSGRFPVSDSTSESYIDAAFDLLSAGAATTPVSDGVRTALLDSKPASGDDALWGKALDALPGAKKEG